MGEKEKTIRNNTFVQNRSIMTISSNSPVYLKFINFRITKKAILMYTCDVIYIYKN